MAVADHSGQAWLQGFNDIGQVVFGMTADELEEIKVSVSLSLSSPITPPRQGAGLTDAVSPCSQDRDNDKFNRVLQNATGAQFNFNCRAKQETFNVRWFSCSAPRARRRWFNVADPQ